MSKKSFIDRINVKAPCSQEWEAMNGNERVRFCDHCAKNVNNLSAVTRKEAKRIVRASGGNICIRYIKHPETGQPVYLDQLVQVRRRAPLFAAGVVSASMSLATISYAQGGTTKAEAPVAAARIKTDVDGTEKEPSVRGVVSGIILDPNGAVVPGATVTLTGDKASEIRRAISDAEGNYRIEIVFPGRYIMQVELLGFADFTSSVLVPEQAEIPVEVALNVGAIEVEVEIKLDPAEVVSVGGAMVIEYTNDLVRAAANGEIDEVRALLKKGENVNGDPEEDEGTTPLAAAVENGHTEIVRLLLLKGAEVDRTDSDKRTPLLMLDEDASADLVKLLLSYGAEISRKDEDGNTALILAAENADADVVEALLKGGPDVNAANEEGQTALMNAASTDDLEMVRLLLNAGADVNLKNEDDETAWDQTSNEEIEALLVSFGAVVNDKDEDDEDESEEPVVN